MIFNRGKYYRFLSEIFIQQRRSYTEKRELEELRRLYDLLKHESLCKVSFKKFYFCLNEFSLYFYVN